ncbi:unnamed protein product [Lactuca saligna]|uniref:Uncharacterized protein n=1 Tax=Lactuca saligna TaxID=75948 RepID=A0AA35Y6J4_LACSI|nr:unnamed protein product [Lactuca saligna]
MEGEWTHARRRRWKQLSKSGEYPRWNRAGVMSMFISNLPQEMATKKAVNRKSFAFVRFKKALYVNIARYERKQVGGSNRHLNRLPQATKFTIKDKRTFAEVAVSGSKFWNIPPPPLMMKCDPIKLSDDSPLRGWMKCTHTLEGVWLSFLEAKSPFRKR